MESNRGLLAAWNKRLGFWLTGSRNSGLATRITSSDEDPILESAFDCPSLDLPHTHLSSSAETTLANVTNTNNAANIGLLPETKRLNEIFILLCFDLMYDLLYLNNDWFKFKIFYWLFLSFYQSVFEI